MVITIPYWFLLMYVFTAVLWFVGAGCAWLIGEALGGYTLAAPVWPFVFVDMAARGLRREETHLERKIKRVRKEQQFLELRESLEYEKSKYRRQLEAYLDDV